MNAYYNENDPKAAAWLRELIARNLIAPGVVDERSIEDVKPADLAGYRQCHFFAGIGGWSLALRQAEVRDTARIWTGSCPCQPFSAAGAGAAFDDKRHLWPAWFHLIGECRPPVVFGEQVASKAAGAWIDLVHADLEGVGYAFGCVPFPAAGIGAPHIRDRNYWVALGDPGGAGLAQRIGDGRVQREAVGSFAREGAIGTGDARGVADGHGRNASAEREQRGGEYGLVAEGGDVVRLAVPDGERSRVVVEAVHARKLQSCGSGEPVRLADADCAGPFSRHGAATTDRHGHSAIADGGADRTGPTNCLWRDADWLGCTDGRWRPVEPGAQPLAHGLPARVVRLRGYGNAIVPEQAAIFVRSAREAIRDTYLPQ